jgi:hypothetical protein
MGSDSAEIDQPGVFHVRADAVLGGDLAGLTPDRWGYPSSAGLPKAAA